MNNLYKNSILYVAANLAVKATSFLMVPIYSYLVSPYEYGQVFIATSFISFMSLFVTCSLHGAINRFFWECNDVISVKKMYSTISYMVAIAAVTMIMIMEIFSREISDFINLPIIYLRIAIISSVFSCFYTVVTALLYVKREAKKISLISIVVGFCQILIQIGMVLSMDNKAMAMILSQLICSIFVFIIYLIYSRPYLIPIFDTQRAWIYLKYSVNQVPSDVSVWLLQFSDRMMINKMKGSSMAGIYGMGQNLGSIPKFFFYSINKAYVPFVFECYKGIEKGENHKMQELKRHTTLIFAIVTVMCTTIIIFSNNVVALLNERYSRATLVMLVMLFAMMIDCYRTIFMNPLTYNVKYIKVCSFIWILSAVINIFLNYYLIPIYAVNGACFVMIFSYTLTFFMIVCFAKKAFWVDYDVSAMGKVFAVSVAASSIMLLGTSWIMFPVKLLLSLLYIYSLTLILKIKAKDLLSKFYVSLNNKLHK